MNANGTVSVPVGATMWKDFYVKSGDRNILIERRQLQKTKDTGALTDWEFKTAHKGIGGENAAQGGVVTDMRNLDGFALDPARPAPINTFKYETTIRVNDEVQYVFPGQNLCVKCHHKRAEPETESATIRGPHSPEGPQLLGEGAGRFPPDFQPEIDKILCTHGSSGNPKLCATCHVAGFTINDAQSGEFVVRSVGHSFKAIPCVDANGAPTNAESCTLAERTFASCATAGCHGSQDAARSAKTTADARITQLVNQLDAMLALPEVAPDNVQNDGRFTVADGAWFNSQLAKMTGSTVHNPFLIEQLLIATINQLRTTYNLPVTVISVSLERQIT
jgi:hypothetical protein